MRGLIPVVVTVALVACDGTGPIPPESDATLCEQTYEFGNLGCADVTGTVLDANHQPQPAASVRVLRPAELGNSRDVASAMVTSAADGTFRLRIRLIFAPSGIVEPDTITVWVRASRPPRTVDAFASSDSALALLTIRPVGQAPAVTTVPDLVLRVP
jgi:hypothetical protein